LWVKNKNLYFYWSHKPQAVL